jgi:hypothetical protein
MSLLIGEDTMDGITDYNDEYRGRPLEGCYQDAGDSLQSLPPFVQSFPASPIRIGEVGDSRGTPQQGFESTRSFNLFLSRDEHYPVQSNDVDEPLGILEHTEEEVVNSSILSSNSEPTNSTTKPPSVKSSTKTLIKSSSNKHNTKPTIKPTYKSSVKSSLMSSNGTYSRSKTSPKSNNNTTRPTTQPKTKQRKQREDWTTDDEIGFYKALRKNGVSQIRDKSVRFVTISNKLKNKSVDQVRAFYYRVLKKINDILIVKGHKVDLQQEDEAISALLCYHNTIQKPQFQPLRLNKKPFMDRFRKALHTAVVQGEQRTRRFRATRKQKLLQKEEEKEEAEQRQREEKKLRQEQAANIGTGISYPETLSKSLSKTNKSSKSSRSPPSSGNGKQRVSPKTKGGRNSDSATPGKGNNEASDHVPSSTSRLPTASATTATTTTTTTTTTNTTNANTPSSSNNTNIATNKATEKEKTNHKVPTAKDINKNVNNIDSDSSSNSNRSSHNKNCTPSKRHFAAMGKAASPLTGMNISPSSSSTSSYNLDNAGTYARSNQMEDEQSETIKLQLVPKTTQAQNSLANVGINPKLQIHVKRTWLVKKVIKKVSKMFKGASLGGGLHGSKSTLRFWPAGDRSANAGYCMDDISVSLNDICKCLHTKNHLKLEYDWNHDMDAIDNSAGNMMIKSILNPHQQHLFQQQQQIQPHQPTPPSPHASQRTQSDLKQQPDSISPTNPLSLTAPKNIFMNVHNTPNTASATDDSTKASTTTTTATTTTAIVGMNNKVNSLTKKGGRRRLQPQLVGQVSHPSLEHRGPAAEHKRSMSSSISSSSPSKKRRITPTLIK